MGVLLRSTAGRRGIEPRPPPRQGGVLAVELPALTSPVAGVEPATREPGVHNPSQNQPQPGLDRNAADNTPPPPRPDTRRYLGRGGANPSPKAMRRGCKANQAQRALRRYRSRRRRETPEICEWDPQTGALTQPFLALPRPCAASERLANVNLEQARRLWAWRPTGWSCELRVSESARWLVLAFLSER